MTRNDIKELHYITPIENIGSVLRHGILSHNQAKKFNTKSVALEEVQKRRQPKRVPGGRPLHNYANLYFHARNPMMFKRKDLHMELCIVRINPKILDTPGVIVTDMNAAKDFARFMDVDQGLKTLDADMVFAEDWRHPGDPSLYYRHRGIKCAEVLVPDKVPPTYIRGVYVSCQQSKQEVLALAPGLAVSVDPHLFFAD